MTTRDKDSSSSNSPTSADRVASASSPLWQRISSAPKDGTRVRLKRMFQGALVAEGEGYFGTVTIHYADDKPQTFNNLWIDADGKHFFPTPTHWQPASSPVNKEPAHNHDCATTPAADRQVGQDRRPSTRDGVADPEHPSAVSAGAETEDFTRGWTQGFAEGHLLTVLEAESPSVNKEPAPVTIDEQCEDDELVATVTEIVRKADQAFQSSGGSSRHWVRDCFLPTLNAEGFRVVEQIEKCVHCGEDIKRIDGEWLDRETHGTCDTEDEHPPKHVPAASSSPVARQDGKS